MVLNCKVYLFPQIHTGNKWPVWHQSNCPISRTLVRDIGMTFRQSLSRFDNSSWGSVLETSRGTASRSDTHNGTASSRRASFPDWFGPWGTWSNDKIARRSWAKYNLSSSRRRRSSIRTQLDGVMNLENLHKEKVWLASRVAQSSKSKLSSRIVVRACRSY